MKELSTIYKELEDRPDFEIVRKDISPMGTGGMGQFIRGPKRRMTVVWSIGLGWEHVSMDGKKRTPDWEEMCELKNMFFEPDECCVQYHPAKKNHVNDAPYCLHIWKPIEKFSGKMPIPPNFLV